MFCPHPQPLIGLYRISARLNAAWGCLSNVEVERSRGVFGGCWPSSVGAGKHGLRGRRTNPRPERVSCGGLAGRLPELWADTMRRLANMAPRLALPPYDPAGCFWRLRGEPSRFPFSDDGGREVLFKVLDHQRVAHAVFRAKYDPEGYRADEARRMRERLAGGKPLPPGLDDRLL